MIFFKKHCCCINYACDDIIDNDPFESVYDKLNIFRGTLSDTVEDLGETSVEIIHG